MKSIWCTIWILGAFLVLASVDSRPDPPAVKPGSISQQKVSPGHEQPDGVALLPVDSAVEFVCTTARPFVARPIEPSPAGSASVLTEQASDPSPPAARA